MTDELDRLERLNRLRESGALTEAEFAAQKARLFAQDTQPPQAAAAPGASSWLWIAGAAAIVLLVVAAVLIGRSAGGGNEAALSNVAAAPDTVIATPSPAADVLPVVTVEDDQLLVDGRPADPPVRGNNSLDIVRSVAVGDHRLYVVQDNGGTACPAQYRIADAGPDGVLVSDGFGTCSDLVRITEQPGGVTISMPGYVGPGGSAEDAAAIAGERHAFRYAGGRVSETVTRDPAAPRPASEDDTPSGDAPPGA